MRGDELVKAAHDYARTARAPTLWLYAKNDSYSVRARGEDGGGVEGGGRQGRVRSTACLWSDGHDIVDDRAGWDVWGKSLDQFLATNFGVATEPQVAQGP